MIAELRLALRHLAKRRLFAPSSIGLLAVGFGLAGTLATVIRDVMLRPFPYANSEGFIVLRQEFPTRNVTTTIHSARDYLDLRSATPEVIAGMGAFQTGQSTLGLGDSPQRVPLVNTTLSGLAMTQLPPVLGRLWTEAEEATPDARVALIGYDLWRNTFNSAPNVLGRTVRLDGVEHTILGVMPPRFSYGGGSVWTPLHVRPDAPLNGRREYYIAAFLRPGATLAQAQAAIQQHYDAVAPSLPPELTEYQNRRARPVLVTEQVLGSMWQSVTALAVAVGLLLLLTAVNLGCLFFLRVAAMRHEIAVRVALGASGRRLGTQLLTEALLLALGGAVLACALTHASVPLFMQLTPRNFIPAEALVQVDAPILIGTFLSAVGIGVLAAAAPVVWAVRQTREEALAGVSQVRRGSRATRKAELLIVVTEVALAFAIVLCTTHLGLAFARSVRADSGFHTEGLTTSRFLLPAEQRNDPATVRAALLRAEEALARLPGVEGAAFAQHRPLAETRQREIGVAGRAPGEPGHRFVTHYRTVSPDYFRTLGMKLVQGRGLSADDGDGKQLVVVINETLARLYFPDQSPLGQALELRPIGGGSAAPRVGLIVGLARDTLQANMGRPGPQPEIFIPIAQADSLWPELSVLVRGRNDVAVPLPTIAATMRAAIGGEVTFYDASDYGALLTRLVGPQRLGATILTVLGIAALVITSAGLYSLLAFSLSQRTREMGIRQAVGAAPRQLVQLFVQRALVLAVPGLALGGVLFDIARDRFGSTVSGQLPFDSSAFSLSLVALLGAAFAASLIPGLRAARVAPSTALRAE